MFSRCARLYATTVAIAAITAVATTPPPAEAILAAPAPAPPSGGEMALWVFVLLYAFMGLAMVCDEFFVAALEHISDMLRLTPDVAGATFMAIGSSAPEFFIAMAANVFSTPGQGIGIATVVGSAIFNILVIIGLTAMVSKTALVLDWRPFARDATCYSVAIALMIAFVWDGRVETWESAVLCVAYVGYIALMYVNPRLMAWLGPSPAANAAAATSRVDDGNGSGGSDTDARAIEEGMGGGRCASAGAEKHPDNPHACCSPRASSGVRTLRASSNPRLTSENRACSERRLNDLITSVDTTSSPAPGGTIEHSRVDAALSDLDLAPSTAPSIAETDGDADGDDCETGYFRDVCTRPHGWRAWVLAAGLRPWQIALKCTIPDVNHPRFQNTRGVVGGFIMSIVWIGVMCWAITHAVEHIGVGVGVPPSIMALTVVAAGTSVPDALASVIVVLKDSNKGDMAVSNAIGSNVFDILFGLGMPFLLSSLVYGEPVPVNTHSLVVTLYLLFGVLAVVVVVLRAAGWKLTKRVGALFLLMYVAYVIFAYTYEMTTEA